MKHDECKKSAPHGEVVFLALPAVIVGLPMERIYSLPVHIFLRDYMVFRQGFVEPENRLSSGAPGGQGRVGIG